MMCMMIRNPFLKLKFSNYLYLFKKNMIHLFSLQIDKDESQKNLSFGHEQYPFKHIKFMDAEQMLGGQGELMVPYFS
jgi:hypothetical protein